MDAWAHKQSLQGSARWISINWDGWQANETKNSPNVDGNATSELAMLTAESMDALQRILCSEQVKSQIIVSTANLQARINKWIKLESLRGHGRGNQPEVVVLQARPPLPSSYLAPRNQTEQTLASIWQELLGIEQIGIRDNFFELGGHSLLATQVISKLRKTFQVDVPIQKLFEAQTIIELAAYLNLSQDQPTSSIITPLANEDAEETRI